jgi:hypothetical protein
MGAVDTALQIHDCVLRLQPDAGSATPAGSAGGDVMHPPLWQQLAAQGAAKVAACRQGAATTV